MTSPEWAGSSTDWGMHELPVSWPIAAENALDPSHAPFLHEGLLGSRLAAAPMRMSLQSEGHWPPLAEEGFVLHHSGYLASQQADRMAAVRSFKPPCNIQLQYTFESGRKLASSLYLVPVRPGVTRTISKYVFQAAPGQVARPVALIYNFAQWFFAALGLLHALGHGHVDQDVIIMHNQERALAQHPKGWRGFGLATPSDTGVDALWHWLQAAGGDVPWAGGQSSLQDLTPRLSREDLLDHFKRHTQYCPECKRALVRVKTLRRVLLLSSFFALAYSSLTASVSMGTVFAQHQVPVLLGVLTALGLRYWLSQVQRMFFGASKPPGSGWQECQPAASLQ